MAFFTDVLNPPQRFEQKFWFEYCVHYRVVSLRNLPSRCYDVSSATAKKKGWKRTHKHKISRVRYISRHIQLQINGWNEKEFLATTVNAQFSMVLGQQSSTCLHSL